MAYPLKILVPVVVVGGAGAIGAPVAYYLLSDSTIIGDKLKAGLEKSRKILTSTSDAEGTEWKEVYKASSSKIVGVSNSDDLPKGCENTLKQKFDQSKYESAKLWCVINTNNLKSEALDKGVTLLLATGNDVNTKWQNAGDKLNKNKTASDAISDSTVISESITSNTQGGPQLQRGCTTRHTWPMYKLGAVNDIDKVVKRCSEDAGKLASET